MTHPDAPPLLHGGAGRRRLRGGLRTAPGLDRVLTADALAGEPISYYCGFDPTAASLHLGHLVQLLNMRRLQLAGHRPLGVVGGVVATLASRRFDRIWREELAAPL